MWQEVVLVGDIPMLRSRSASEYWKVLGVCASIFCIVRTLALVVGWQLALPMLQFALAYAAAPPITVVGGAYASACLGNDRWSLDRNLKSWLAVGPIVWAAAIGIRFGLGAIYFVSLVPGAILSMIASSEITRTRYETD